MTDLVEYKKGIPTEVVLERARTGLSKPLTIRVLEQVNIGGLSPAGARLRDPYDPKARRGGVSIYSPRTESEIKNVVSEINKARDARMIGYGGMLGEGSLAIATIIASVAGIALVTNCEINGVFHEELTWGAYYDTWEHAAKNKFMGFFGGGLADCAVLPGGL